MLRSQKSTVVDELEAEMRSSSAMILTEYRGLSVAQMRVLRNDLRALDATFHVTKNTLARVAAERVGDDALPTLLAGPTAIAFCRGDVAAVAKRLSDAARTTRILTLRGAVMDGRVLDQDGVRKLATLPSREVLQGQVVGTIAAPLTTFVQQLAAVPREMVVVLDQIIQKKQAEAA